METVDPSFGLGWEPSAVLCAKMLLASGLKMSHCKGVTDCTVMPSKAECNCEMLLWQWIRVMSREGYKVYVLLLDSQSSLKNISGNNTSPCQGGLKQLPASNKLQHFSCVTSPHCTLCSSSTFQKSPNYFWLNSCPRQGSRLVLAVWASVTFLPSSPEKEPVCQTQGMLPQPHTVAGPELRPTAVSPDPHPWTWLLVGWQNCLSLRPGLRICTLGWPCLLSPDLVCSWWVPVGQPPGPWGHRPCQPCCTLGLPFLCHCRGCFALKDCTFTHNGNYISISHSHLLL